MAFDYKKEYKEFYMPNNKPSIVTVPSMNYIAVRGTGNPNQEDGEYKQSIGLLYGIAFTVKMSKKGDHRIEGYFDYVVPPLEGFWWQGAASVKPNSNTATEKPPTEGREHFQLEGVSEIDYSRKEDFNWISVIRLPDFVTKEDLTGSWKRPLRRKRQIFRK